MQDIQNLQQPSNLISMTEQDRASHFVKNIIKDVIERRGISLNNTIDENNSRVNKYENQTYNPYLSNSNESKRLQEQENNHYHNSSLSYQNYPSKSPSSISQLFKKSNHQSQRSLRVPLNEFITKVQQPFQIQYEQSQSPVVTTKHPYYEALPLSTINKSTMQLCSFCKQTMNISGYDNTEQKQMPKNRSLGFYNYNFIYVVGQNTNISQKQRKMSHYMDLQSEKENKFPNTKKSNLNTLDDVCQSQNLKSSKKFTMRTSGVNLQSFDFELSISQIHRDQQIQINKERQFSEVCVSQVVSQVLNNPPSVLKDDKYYQSSPIFKDNIQKVKEQYIMNTQKSEVQIVKDSLQKMSETDRASIIQFLDIEVHNLQISNRSNNFNKNIQQLQTLMPPLEEKEKIITRPSQNREFRSDPLELVSDFHRNPDTQTLLQQTPLSRILDQLDVSFSQILFDSVQSSPSKNFQLNLMNQFEKTSVLRPQKLMKRVFQQIETLKDNIQLDSVKITQKYETSKNSSKRTSDIKQRPLSKQKLGKSVTSTNSQPSLYQKVLSSGMRR